MLLTLFAVLLVMWLLGLFAFHATGGLIHLLLIVAVISLVFSLPAWSPLRLSQSAIAVHSTRRQTVPAATIFAASGTSSVAPKKSSVRCGTGQPGER
jgi:hypothetical protein